VGSSHGAGRAGACALILTYHRVGDVAGEPWRMTVPSEQFAEHIAQLQADWNPVSLRDLVAALDGGHVPPRAAAVTFDDGYADNLHHALPVLERYGVPATVFVATGFVGSEREFWSDELERILLQPSTLPAALDLALDDFKLHWELAEEAIYDSDAVRRHREWRASSGTAPTARHGLYLQLWERLRQTRPEVRDTVMERIAAWAGAEQVPRSTHRPLTLDELRTLGKHDLIEIGAHSVTHSSLAALPAERQREEIMVSKRFLEEATQGEVRAFAYPYGGAADYTSATIEMLREAAFDCACANFGGAVVAKTDVFQLPRLVAPALAGGDFARYLGAALRLPVT